MLMETATIDAEETVQDTRTINLLDLLSGDGDTTIEVEGTVEDSAEGPVTGSGDGTTGRPQTMTSTNSCCLHKIHTILIWCKSLAARFYSS